jgi:hypothetical protein
LRASFSASSSLAAKQDKVNELQQGRAIPLDCLYVVRLWHGDPELLAARCASLKNAFISMRGPAIHHATIPENARQLFYQTWPGWTYAGLLNLKEATTILKITPRQLRVCASRGWIA